MRVRMKVGIVGPRDGQDWPKRGGEFVVSDAEGADLCANGYAEPVAEREQVETATAPKVETRKPRARKVSD